MPVFFSGAVEGLVDEAVFERLIRTANGHVHVLHRTEGKPRLLERLRGFNQAARREPWLVLVDLDEDADCAPPFRRSCLPDPSPKMVFRIAVHSVEAWLLADRERFSRWFQVPVTKLPARPDEEPDAKRVIVNLARRSRSRVVREGLVPRETSRRQVGSLYTSYLIQFVHDESRGWRPRVAARASDSLDRCLRHLRRLSSQGRFGGQDRPAS